MGLVGAASAEPADPGRAGALDRGCGWVRRSTHRKRPPSLGDAVTERGAADRPRATVVVTTYNQEQWIEQALDSVAAQTEQRLQLIVTDDGSHDGSCERISNWIERNDCGGVLVASERNVGLPAVLNLALPLFEGEYVVVLNGDDWMDPERIERQAEFLDQADDAVGLVLPGLLATVGGDKFVAAVMNATKKMSDSQIKKFNSLY